MDQFIVHEVEPVPFNLHGTRNEVDLDKETCPGKIEPGEWTE